MKKRILAALLCGVMVVSSAAVCTAGETEGEKKKISIITIPASAAFPDGTSIMENEFFDLIEEETGYEIEWQLFKSGDYDEQISMLLASGNAPDLIQVNYSSLIGTFAKQGGLAVLNDALETNGDYLSEIYTEEALDACSVNGELYALPRYTGGGAGIGSLAVRQDWLDELGLEAPTTLDELYEVLKAIKEAKPECTPLIIDGTLGRLTEIMGAFGIPSNRTANFVIKDGKASMPLLEEEGKEFIQYMNKLYTEGLIDPEFLIEEEAIQQMIAGNGAMMSINYVEIVRNMAAFEEKNPEGELTYIEPIIGENGEQGYLSQSPISLAWIVPKTSEDKVNDCVDFLNKCNASEKIVNAICLGFEGEHYNMVDGEVEKTDAFSDVVYKGYYSRVICDSTFDDWNNTLEGFDEVLPFVNEYKNDNPILYTPLDVPEDSDSISEIETMIINGVLKMIVEGYTDESFAALQDKFDELGGNDILAQYQEWYDSTL